jgi:anthranilate/para-aminobenzoate synthase component I
MHAGAMGELSDWIKHGEKMFSEAAQSSNQVPVIKRVPSDYITPVMAYEGLVRNAQELPSFLFESVTNGTDTGRYSLMGACPELEILVKENRVTVLNHVEVMLCPPCDSLSVLLFSAVAGVLCSKRDGGLSRHSQHRVNPIQGGVSLQSLLHTAQKASARLLRQMHLTSLHQEERSLNLYLE